MRPQDKLVEGLYPLSYGCVWGYYAAGVAEVNFYYRAELDVNPVELAVNCEKF